MIVIRETVDERSFPCATSVVTWGVFDGLHSGHRKILGELSSLAARGGGSSVVVTFHPHPEEILYNRKIASLCSLDQRIDLIGRQGIDYCVVIPFTKEFASLSAEDFIRDFVIGRLHAKAIVLGPDSAFGRDRLGNFSVLKAVASELAIDVAECPPETIDGKPVSSTLIRREIERGNIAGAEAMLSHPFVLSGEVVKGAGRGRTLGFPTANILPNGCVTPPTGVYATIVYTGESKYPGITNIGKRPTFPRNDPELTIESYMPAYTGGDLYGRKIGIRFVQKLRDEKAFATPDELLAQIREDVRKRFSK